MTTSSDIAAKARNRSVDTMPVPPHALPSTHDPHLNPLKQAPPTTHPDRSGRKRTPDRSRHMDRGRCGPLVEARNAPWLNLSHAQEVIGTALRQC
ncbi:hypothetical protein GCM10010306_046980 [Streptomyces umbrinus]|nr:hypothetical protein GCM10010306_046980 [Streptomyces umbrinus]